MDKIRIDAIARDLLAGQTIGEVKRRYGEGRQTLDEIVHARRLNLIGDAYFSQVRYQAPVQHGFPSDPTDRLQVLLPCISTEIKQSALLTMNYELMTAGDVRREINKYSDEDLPSVTSFRNIFQKDFVAIGLLVHDILGQGFNFGDVHYFSLTDEGQMFAVPLAAFSLRYAVDNEVSLYQLLGSVNSNGTTRGPYNRFRIVNLVNQGFNNVEGISTKLDLGPVAVGDHLSALAKLNIVRFDSIDVAEGEERIWQWVEGKDPNVAQPVHTHIKLTHDVAQWLAAQGSAAYKSIKVGVNRSQNGSNISNVLSGLYRQGFVTTEYFGHRSLVRPGPRFSLFVDYMEKAIDLCAEGPALSTMTSVAAELKASPGHLGGFMDLGIAQYKAISPHINTLSLDKRSQLVIDYLKTAAHSEARPVEIATKLGWEDAVTVKTLKLMVMDGVLSSERKGRQAIYRLTVDNSISEA
ncbi:TPA: hypothetical protein HA241_01100 [Candidatus Woesearchaeota archaeon]|nr:hypothetical protein [Candidatus Woesearchaeota archaeon]